jgi:hypothetical protein
MSTKRYTRDSMTEKETKRAPFAIRMQPTVKAAGERAAKDQNRSLASLMETLLIEHLRANGYLPETSKQAGKKR